LTTSGLKGKGKERPVDKELKKNWNLGRTERKGRSRRLWGKRLRVVVHAVKIVSRLSL